MRHCNQNHQKQIIKFQKNRQHQLHGELSLSSINVLSTQSHLKTLSIVISIDSSYDVVKIQQ